MLTNSQKNINDFITGQFDLYKKNGVELQQIEHLRNLNSKEKEQIGFCRIQIVDNKIYAENNVASNFPYASLHMFKTLISSLQRVVKRQKISNVDFVFFATDILEPGKFIKDQLLNLPSFMMSTNLSSDIEKRCLLLPDAYLLSEQIWPPLIREIEKGRETYLWPEKDSTKIFWRGATTGGTYNLDSFSKLPRLALVMLSKLYPDRLDARFMFYSQFSDDPSGRNLYIILNKLFDNPGRLPEKDHLKYKYLISLDGNTAAWLRVPWILLSNSVLLKQETQVTQIFYPGLIPYVHYVPVKEDLSDIFEKLSWLQSNDNKALEISHNATEFVYNNLLPEKLDEYLVIILEEYYKLQRFNVDSPSLPLMEFMNH